MLTLKVQVSCTESLTQSISIALQQIKLWLSCIKLYMGMQGMNLSAIKCM